MNDPERSQIKIKLALLRQVLMDDKTLVKIRKLQSTDQYFIVVVVKLWVIIKINTRLISLERSYK